MTAASPTSSRVASWTPLSPATPTPTSCHSRWALPPTVSLRCARPVCRLQARGRAPAPRSPSSSTPDSSSRTAALRQFCECISVRRFRRCERCSDERQQGRPRSADVAVLSEIGPLSLLTVESEMPNSAVSHYLRRNGRLIRASEEQTYWCAGRATLALRPAKDLGHHGGNPLKGLVFRVPRDLEVCFWSLGASESWGC